MPQKLFEDKIGSLSHSAGSITLAASRLTVGGQQYVTSSLTRAIATDLTMAANTLYMIYAVLNSGVVELRFSTNVNSVGPAGFTAWKLVGAFYSNSASAWGSFVTIEGTPTSDFFLHVPTYSSSGGGAAPGTLLINQLFVKRIGDQCFANWIFRQNSLGTTGTGDYLVSLPFVADTNKAKTGLGTVQGNQGSARLNVSSGSLEATGYALLYNTTNFTIWVGDEAVAPAIWGASLGSFGANTNLDAAASFQYPVSGWGNTPLKDL